jgi:HEAT repeat protein
MVIVLLGCLTACARHLPAQAASTGSDSISNTGFMNNSDSRFYADQFYSEHGEDRRAAIGWFCAHPEEGRAVLHGFFQPLENEWAAEAALEALGCIGHPADVAMLDSVLASGKLSYKAGIALAKNPDPAALEVLMKRSKDANEGFARGAISGLGERGDQAARSKLEGLLHDPNSNIRWAAVLAIADLGAKPSEPLLRECFKSESNKDVRNKIKEILN